MQRDLVLLCMKRLSKLKNAPIQFSSSLPEVDATRIAWQSKVVQFASALKQVKVLAGEHSAAYADALEVSDYCKSKASPDALIIEDLQKIIGIKVDVLGKLNLSTIESNLHFDLYLQSIGGKAGSFADFDMEALNKCFSEIIGPVRVSSSNQSLSAAKLEERAELMNDLLCLAYLYAGFQMRNGDATAAVNKSVAIAKTVSGDTRALNLLIRASTLYGLLGEYAAARSALMEANRICGQTTDYPMQFEIQTSLARLALLQADYGAAADTAQESLLLVEHHLNSNPERKLECYKLLATAESGRGNIEKGIEFTRRILAEPSGVAAPQTLASIKTQLGSLLSEHKDWSEAEQVLKQSLALTETSSNAAMRIQTARTYLALGSLYARQNSMQTASENYSKAVDIFKQNLNRELVPSYVRALNGSAAALLALGEVELARARVFTSAATVSEYIEHVFRQLSFAEQCAFIKVADEESGALFAISRGDAASMEKAYEYSAGWKGLLVESLRSESELFQHTKNNSNLEKLVNELGDKRRLLAGASQGTTQNSVAYAKQLEHEVEALEQRIQQESGVTLQVSLPSLLRDGIKYLSDLLKPDESFVDIIKLSLPDSAQATLGAVVISREGFKFVALGSEHELDDLVDSWRNSITGEQIRAWGKERALSANDSVRGTRDVQVDDPVEAGRLDFRFNDMQAKIQHDVWSKIADALPQTTKKIFLCSEGSLARIPWASVAGSSLFVAEMDSPSEFVALQKRQHSSSVNSGAGGKSAAPAQSSKVVVAGDIAFNDPLKRVSDLSGTKIELSEIEELAKVHRLNVVVLSREDATKAAVVSALSDASFAHIATHGFARSGGGDSAAGTRSATVTVGKTTQSVARNPLLDTGLYFSFPRNGKSDGSFEEPGILTASEIVGLDLKSCNLVSLSACQTGLGRDLGGQGVVGLRSSIIAAGAQSVLMSMWKVDDEATQELMHQFYRNLWLEGKSKAEALRLAQDSVRTDKKHPEWSQPRYWAAWTIVGQAW